MFCQTFGVNLFLTDVVCLLLEGPAGLLGTAPLLRRIR